MLTILIDSISVYIDDNTFEVKCDDEGLKTRIELIIKEMLEKRLFLSVDIYLTMGCGGKILKYLQEIYKERLKFVKYAHHDLGPDEPGVIY